MKEFEFDIEVFKDTAEDKLKVEKYTSRVWEMYDVLYGEGLDDDDNPLDIIFDGNVEALLIATTESEVIGYARLDRDDFGRNTMNLSQAFVDERYRRRGVYKRLTEERIRIAKNQGALKVYVSPNSDANTYSYFESIGFKYVAEDRDLDDGLFLDL